MQPFDPARSVRASTARRATLLATALCVSLAGCQTPPSPGAKLAADPADPCQAERTAFADSKTYFQDQVTSGAITGAAMGAGMGALAGLAKGGTLKSALVGGLVGGAIGGLAGAGTAYYNTLAEHAADQYEVANYMNQDLARETQEIDHSGVTFARLRACRFAQAQYVKSLARHHQIDRPAALAQIAYNRDKFNEELGIAHEFGLTMARRSQQFQEAANDLKTRPPAASATAPAPTSASKAKLAQVDKAAAVSVPEKRASYDKTVASAERTSKTAFDLDSNASLSWLLSLGFDA
jgi:hypothetical protein